MKVLTRLRPTPAMVVACIALTVALGGTGYAAIKLPKNSVGAKQLKKNAVTNPKIKASAVTNAKIGASAVTGTKVANDSLTGADVNEATLAKVPAATTADTAAPTGAAGGDLAGSTYPNPTIAAGVITPAKFGAMPQVRATKTVGQPIATSGVGVFAAVTWDAVQYDTAGIFNPATPDRLTAPIAGVYAIEGGVRWTANATGFRFAGICLNQPPATCTANDNIAVSEYATNDDPGVGALKLTQQSVSTHLKLNAGDVVRLVVTQDSGATVTVDGLPATFFAMSWIGKG